MSISDTITQPETLVAFAAAGLAFMTIVTLAAPLLKRDNLAGRLKSVANRREELRRRSREALAKGKEGSLRRRDESVYKTIVDRLQLSKLLEDPKVADKLAEAGFRGPKPVSTFYFFRFCLPIVFGLVSTLWLFGVAKLDWPTFTRLAIVCGSIAAGFYGPNIYVTNIAGKRRQSPG